MTAALPTLDELRGEVDEIDKQLVELLARRREVVARVAAVKREAGGVAIDPAREAALARAWSREAESRGVPVEAALRVLRAVLDGSRAHVVELVGVGRAEP